MFCFPSGPGLNKERNKIKKEREYQLGKKTVKGGGAGT